MSIAPAQIPVPAISQKASPSQEEGTLAERDFYSEVGTRLKKLRDSRGFTQEGLAEKSGVSLKMIQRYERGKSGRGNHANPRLETLVKLASAFDIEVSELLETRYDAQLDLDLEEAEEKWAEQAAASFTNTARDE